MLEVVFFQIFLFAAACIMALSYYRSTLVVSKGMRVPVRTLLCTFWLAACGFTNQSHAQDQFITNVPVPVTNPSRSSIVRSRLVDSQFIKAWRGAKGANTIRFDLGSSQQITGVILNLKRPYRARSLVVRGGSQVGNLIAYRTLAGVNTGRGAPLRIENFAAEARVLEVEMIGKRSRRRARRGSTPKVVEIQILTAPLWSSTPTPTPTPPPTPTPTIPPLVIDQSEPISINDVGAQSESDSREPSVSDDGRFVVYSTDARKFIAGASTGGVILRDRQLGTTELISREVGGKSAAGWNPAISGDGNFIVFASNSNGIVAGDSNSGLISDVFLYERKTKTTYLVSKSSAGVQTTSSCFFPQVSDTGRYVVFACEDTNLVPGDNNNFEDLFWHDVVTGETKLVSGDMNGLPSGNDHALNPSISDDGRYVVFDSRSTNLVPNDLNQTSDVFVRDTSLDSTTLASVNMQGGQADAECDYPHISGDGTYVVYQTFAQNLDVSVSTRAIVRHNRLTKQNILISKDSAGVSADNENFMPKLSDDGRYVSFDSMSTNLDSDSSAQITDVFLHDSVTGQTILVSKNQQGVQGNGHSGGMGIEKALSGDGTTVVYITEATNLLSNDLNNRTDIMATTLKR